MELMVERIDMSSVGGIQRKPRQRDRSCVEHQGEYRKSKEVLEIKLTLLLLKDHDNRARRVRHSRGREDHLGTGSSCIQ